MKLVQKVLVVIVCATQYNEMMTLCFLLQSPPYVVFRKDPVTGNITYTGVIYEILNALADNLKFR